jgi:hypothetical protein
LFPSWSGQGLISIPIYIYIYLLSVLCPVRRPVTALDFVLLKDNNLAFAAQLGLEINFLVYP